mmetsp:Transcript_70071/g.200812  ORF Transcript_70071/g.200812 Transcript_70071/m.200812 type:complete len:229 (+) Transcript_70071:463-1149(+)
MEVLKPKIRGPEGVSTSSVCKQPEKCRPSLRMASKSGRKTFSSKLFSISSSTKGEGAKAPMPSVTGPRSSSLHRFWSCVAAGTIAKFTPSLKASTETSGNPEASPSPLDAAAIGKPSFCTRVFENACEDSSSAAACEGPKVGTPAERKTSARPSWSSCSEPTTARTMERSRQKSLTSLKCGGVSGTSTGITGAVCTRAVEPFASSCSALRCACPWAVWPEMPPLPGAT